MMRNYPIDSERLLANVKDIEDIDPVLKTDDNGKPTGEQAVDQDGVKKWKLVLPYKEIDPGRAKPVRHFIEIGFSAEEAPKKIPGGTLILENLVGMPWQNEYRGRFSAGVALKADRVEILPPNQPRRTEPAPAN
jgi:hypothetical protein